jgi:hypothetical protein
MMPPKAGWEAGSLDSAGMDFSELLGLASAYFGA